MNALKDYVEWKLTHSDKTAEAEGYPLILEDCKKNKMMKELKVYGASIGELITDETDVNYGKYKITVVQKGKNLFKPVTTSCTWTTNINNGSLTNNYGTSIDSTNLSDNVVVVKQSQRDTTVNPNSYLNGYFDIFHGGLIEGESYILSFDIDIHDNPLNASEFMILPGGQYPTYYASFSKTKQRVYTTFVEKHHTISTAIPYLEIRCMGMSFTASNFMITEVGYDTDFEPYVEPIVHNVFINEPLGEGEVLDVKEHIPLPKLTSKTTVFTVDSEVEPSNMYGKYIK